MGDKLGQQYTTPETSIIDQKSDIIIVGRGITDSENRIETAIKYKNAAFNSYLKRINL
jgi:uridine monophosphate synthetase